MGRKYNNASIIYVNPPKDEESVIKYANMLSDTGYFPNGLDACFCVGIAGGCGIDCIAYKAGNCPEPEEITKE